MSAGVGDPNPTFVTDIHLDLSQPAEAIPVSAGYASALGIVRLHGVPLEALSLPVIDGEVPQ